jgi:ppGpp synthetase/RelA/SpoT-type nucleotidyltranferase
MTKLTSQFVERYRREFDFFDQAARLAHGQLEAALSSSGIRAMVTYRAKRPDRLLVKLNQRQDDRQYATDEAIYEDIADLAGVRVALYFPATVDQVDQAIRAQFELVCEPKLFPVQPVKELPYTKRFSGYNAQHYRVRLKESDLQEPQRRYAVARIEIQVASLLMHAWAEVEHDLIYKPLQGQLSEDEYAVLDELNGLVLTGEIALERLQRASEARVTKDGTAFESRFDLAAYLLRSVPQEMKTNESALGHVDMLYELLKHLKLNSPEHVKAFVAKLHSDTGSKTISEQIVDQVVATDEQRYSAYTEIRRKSEIEPSISPIRPRPTRSVDTVIQTFMRSWVDFEHILSGALKSQGGDRIPTGRHALERWEGLTAAQRRELDRIWSLRNRIVHGPGEPDLDELREASQSLKQLLAELRSTPAGTELDS